MNRIHVSTERAVIEIQSTPAKMVIRTPRPKMHIKSIKPRMRVQRRMPKFKVDWDKVNSERNAKPPVTLARYQRDVGKANLLSAIAQIVQNGDRAARFYIEGNPFAEQARNRARKDIKDINIASVPSTQPEFEWEKGSLEIEWERHQLEIEWDVQQPQVDVEPYDVEVRVRNRPRVKVWVDPEHEKQQKHSGKRVDKKI